MNDFETLVSEAEAAASAGSDFVAGRALDRGRKLRGTTGTW